MRAKSRLIDTLLASLSSPPSLSLSNQISAALWVQLCDRAPPFHRPPITHPCCISDAIWATQEKYLHKEHLLSIISWLQDCNTGAYSRTVIVCLRKTTLALKLHRKYYQSVLKINSQQHNHVERSVIYKTALVLSFSSFSKLWLSFQSALSNTLLRWGNTINYLWCLLIPRVNRQT